MSIPFEDVGVNRFVVGAIPLSRPAIVDFLFAAAHTGDLPGAPVTIVGQRPRSDERSAWISGLPDRPTTHQVLEIADPHRFLVNTTTTRLVPRRFLSEPEFLTRALGGWAPVYFGVLGLGIGERGDPLLDRLEVLADYGPVVRFVGADADMVQGRIAEEVGSLPEFVSTLRGVAARLLGSDDPPARVRNLVASLHGEGAIAPRPSTVLVLYDALMQELVEIESARRLAEDTGDGRRRDEIAAWQDDFAEALGVRLILKGEYIMGRHRRSTVLLAPELGVVVKQPAPEPLHEAEIGRVTVHGVENWPRVSSDGALVMPHGRIRLVLEEGVVGPLHEVFDHRLEVSTVLGLTIEPWVAGATLQEAVRLDAEVLTPARYEEILLHQLVCERMGVENGDWHSANFIIRGSDDALVHVDWGAARPLDDGDQTESGREARLRQVRNLGFSFHDRRLAHHTADLHDTITGDALRMQALRSRAEGMARNR